MSNITDKLVNYIQEKSQINIPKKVYVKAHQCIIDYLGVTYAGAKTNKELFDGKDFKNKGGSCSLIGYGQKADCLMAAFVNGFNAHTIELDDGSRFGMIHLGGVIISAVLAATQQENIPYRQILKGVIMGYEAAVRTSVAIQPGHKKRGFHTSGTCGTIGAAVGVAVALKYNEVQLKSAISAAATSAAGLLEIQEDSSLLKPYNVGHAAMSGVNAAIMGRTGIVGPDDILGGNRGMFRLLSDDIKIETLIEQAEYFEIERIYVKPYASCRHCHSAIEATLSLKKKYNIPSENIDKINIYTYSLAVKGHDHTVIKGVSSAKLSMPYSVASAYILSDGGLEAFNEENISDSKILELTKKVNVIENEEFSQKASIHRISEVHIIGTDGMEIQDKVEYAKGDPENPMTNEEINDKFIQLMKWSGNEQLGYELLEKLKVEGDRL